MMEADFNCDVDWDSTAHSCEPVWSFTRLDTSDFSRGYHHTVLEQYVNSTEDGYSRFVLKYYGIKLEVRITGWAGKFDFNQLVIVIGSGLAFLSLASALTDLILQNLWSGKDAFNKVATIDLHEAEAVVNHANDTAGLA